MKQPVADEFAPGSVAFYRRMSLPAVCLLIIVAVQVVRVRAYHQSPWKGGGFGMFSTVDTVAARYLKIYLVTDQGEIPVAPPLRHGQRAHQLRAAPSQVKLDALTDRLAAATWISTERKWINSAQRAAPAAGAGPLREMGSDDQRPDDHPAGAAIVTLRRGDLSRVRALLNNEPRPPDRDIVACRAIRVEVWRYDFHADRQQMESQRLLSATRAVGEELP